MMIGARTAAWAKSGYTAKHYVQDGLIAMWDGIENAGVGKHVDSIASVPDLSGNGHTLHFSGGFEVGADYFRNTNFDNVSTIDGSEISDELITNGYTVEAVSGFESNVYSADGSFLAFFVSDSVYLACYSYAANLLAFSNNWKTFHGDETYTKQIISTSFRSTPSCSVNGNPASIVNFRPICSGLFSVCSLNTVGTYSLRKASTLKIKSLRVYRRILSAAEVAANYVIDAARFNLAPFDHFAAAAREEAVR